MEGSKLFEKYITRYPYIEAIILTDNEGISICSAANAENKRFVDEKGYMIFTAAFSQANENIAKLNQKQCRALTNFYDSRILH